MNVVMVMEGVGVLRGRNVCRYYLMGVYKFGERCSYAHTKEYLLHKGWWSTTEWIERERKQYNFLQTCNKAIADYDKQVKASTTGQKSKKKHPKGKSGGQSARPGGPKPTVYSPSVWGGYDSDGDDEYGMFGFTSGEVDELLCQGIKPWDDDARGCFTCLLIQRLAEFPLLGCLGCSP